MIRLMKRFISWLKTIFGGERMSFEFPKFEIAKIEEQIEVKKNGKIDGSNDNPRAGSDQRSKCEEEATIKIDKFRGESVKKAVEYLKPIKRKISESQHELDQTPYYFEQFSNDIKRTVDVAIGKLRNLKNAFLIENKQVRRFKLENQLSREPKPLTMMNIIIGLIIITVLFLIELEVNSNLLAPAMTSGKAEGMAIAGAVAGLNVIVSFFIGYIALKHFHHVQLKKRIMSKVVLLFYSLFIIYLNWMMGAYRSIYEATGENLTDVLTGDAVAEAVLGSATFPWTVSLTFTSLVLVFVGLGFALLSLIDGYFFDDRYPGYGSVGKVRKEKEEELNRITQHISTEAMSKANLELRLTREKQGKLQKTILTKWVECSSEIASVFEQYRRFARELEEGVQHACKEYQDENREYRNTPAPKYWETKQTLPEDKKQPEKVFLDFVDFHLSREEIEKKRKIYQDQINNGTNKYIGQINEFMENIQKQIADIITEYKVDLDDTEST